MKIIALEEQSDGPGIPEAAAGTLAGLAPTFSALLDPNRRNGAKNGFASPITGARVFGKLADIGAGRIADMDAGGITMQVLSTNWAQQLPAAVAEDLCRTANNRVAAAVREHPGRFAGFAALPTAVPEAAAAEFDRCVSELGFVGAFVMGRTGGEFLDHPRFDPVLARAERLGVPIYLHPVPPPAAVSEANYAAGLDPLVTAWFQTGAWGWHDETGIHFIHMILSGVFDKYPDLQIILGHWGELVPYYAERLDASLPGSLTGLQRLPSEYLRQNAYIAPSGMFSHKHLKFCIDTVGVDRIVFAVDYPYLSYDGAVEFLQTADLSDADKHAIAHMNAERLLKL